MHYALNSRNLIHIDKARMGQEFFCPACNHPVQPTKNGFQHIQESEYCSPSVYLHSAGKLLFKYRYEIALESSAGFFIKYFITNPGGQKILKQFDLTSRFKHIFLDKPDGPFTPDIILMTDTGQKLYVEIAVSHYCSPQKRDSGIRIVEIELVHESDLGLFFGVLSEDDWRISFHNFRR